MASSGDFSLGVMLVYDGVVFGAVAVLWLWGCSYGVFYSVRHIYQKNRFNKEKKRGGVTR